MIFMRPYLVRALYDWITDNDWTPHLIVDAEIQGVEIPREFVQDGKIILNILPSAVKNLELGDEMVSFEARFSGKALSVFVPIQAVLAVYAKENSLGMTFPEESFEFPEPPPPPRPSKPMLRRVK